MLPSGPTGRTRSLIMMIIIAIQNQAVQVLSRLKFWILLQVQLEYNLNQP